MLTTLFRFAILVLMLSAAVVTFAQEGGGNAPPPDAPEDSRQGVLRDLGLNRQQLDQIRTIRQSQRKSMETAQQRVREANRNLDEAIYSDDATEETIILRLEELHAAQVEVLRNRSMTEFRIRKVLTPEQLRRFRDARKRFGEGRQQGPDGPRGPGQRPPGREGPVKRPGPGPDAGPQRPETEPNPR